MANAEVRTVQFAQGVGLAVPPIVLDGQGKVSIPNNATTVLTPIGFYLASIRSITIDYTIYRRTDSGFKWSSGQLKMVAVPDAILFANQWVLSEPLREDEVSDRGIVFSLTVTDAGKSNLTATADNMAGANYSCTMFYKLTLLQA